ncbi:hypothetical protein [Aurantimonas coralicida]|uniref:hypothetical protein n=1 Tax=Aurantimonas coralicida TaxID=182270 RepID=UPI001E52915B|nr:hypothetical protein [Aurantimonas coralicida]MCD1643084.1 hypothetical protein [Aurantimonas coralicida]
MTITSRVVCEQCNNGWMSRLEVRARPILTPLILGEECVISTGDQVVIASWIAKTAMVGEYLYETGAAASTREEREILRLEGVPPPNWFIRISPLLAVRWRVGHHHYSASVAVSRNPKIRAVGIADVRNVQWTMMGINRLFFLASSSSIDPNIGNFDIQGAQETQIPRIWPNPQGEIKWNPSIVVNDSVVERFALGQRKLIAGGMN